MSEAGTTSEVRGGTAGEALHALLEEDWDARMRESPTRASMLGDRRWNDHWPDRSLAAIHAEHGRKVATLDRLKAIDLAALTPADRLNVDLFRQEIETDVAVLGLTARVVEVGRQSDSKAVTIGHRGGCLCQCWIRGLVRRRSVK